MREGKCRQSFGRYYSKKEPKNLQTISSLILEEEVFILGEKTKVLLLDKTTSLSCFCELGKAWSSVIYFLFVIPLSDIATTVVQSVFETGYFQNQASFFKNKIKS